MAGLPNQVDSRSAAMGYGTGIVTRYANLR